MTAKKILLVEDDADIASTVEYNLSQEGYNPKVVSNGADSIITVRKFKPDLILLDVMLPGMDGFEICKRLKADDRTRDIPVIMLTVKSSDVDVVLGLELGADDYVTKPFSIRVLLARVKNILKRAEGAAHLPSTINYHDVVIDRERREIYVGEEKKHFSRTEFDILALLASRPGKVFSRNSILENCWPDGVFVIDRSVDVHINSIRKKLGDVGANIESVRGIGYRIRE